jgi:tRNA/tmRNA/rRNA uracil-C5-methylase (TrmA/RlmC/RlmD family)
MMNVTVEKLYHVASFVAQGSFSQPNAGVCEKMLEWAVDVTRGSEDHDLLVGCKRIMTSWWVAGGS